MTESHKDLARRTPLWRLVTSRDSSVQGRSAAEVLASVRRGVGKPAGTAPGLWPFYTQLGDGSLTPQLQAEHVAMTLFAAHQQSQSGSMHRTGPRLGRAMRQLADSQPRGADTQVSAMDRRMNAIATSTSFRELAEHLRRAITLLRGESIPLDYDCLYRDLLAWQSPQLKSAVVRRWGADYFVRTTRPDHDNSRQAVAS